MKRVLALVLSLPFAAAAAPHKILDLRNQSSVDEYEISLCARPTPPQASATQLPGHAFVAYSFKKSGQQRRFEAIGLTTNASAIQGILSYSSLLAKPTGFLKEEHYTSVKEQCLVLQVSKPDFDKAYAATTPFAQLPGLETVPLFTTYSLASNDCETFMIGVANQFLPKGVKVPKREATDLPIGYIRKLIDAN